MVPLFQFKRLASIPQLIHQVTQKDPTQPYLGSLALHTGEPAQAILKNRNHLAQIYPTMQFVVANQTHRANIKVITQSQSRGWEQMEDAIEDCDALLTQQKGVMLTILTADCVPILLVDPQKEVIGAVHAGWRGTDQKILYQTVERMRDQFGSHPRDIIAGIAPAIGRCCYEVDQKVASHFGDYLDVMDSMGEKFMLDLPTINEQQLLQAGLLPQNIEKSNICTACDVQDYFSYRQEQGCSGRFMSMIGLAKE